MVNQFETPKALANFERRVGAQRSDNPGLGILKPWSNPERVKTSEALNTGETLSGLGIVFVNCSQGCRYAPTLG